MAVLAVVPSKECLTMASGVLNAAKSIREVGSILHRLELRLREWEMCSNTFPVVCCAQRYVVLSMYMSQRRARLKELDATYKQE